MVLQRIGAILESCADQQPKLRPTILYSEGWLLRLVLEWFSTHSAKGHALNFDGGSRWFSEALLPSAFVATRRSDPLAEGWTNADGAIGHFDIGDAGKGDLKLRDDADQLVIVEAKMSGDLSSGVTNAPYYDQAARTVACVAEALERAMRPARAMTSLGYCLLAPQERISEGGFDKLMTKESIGDKVERRVKEWVEEHKDDKWEWHSQWFRPVLETVRLSVLSWEEVLATITTGDIESGEALRAFYDQCLKFNS